MIPQTTHVPLPNGYSIVQHEHYFLIATESWATKLENPTVTLRVCQKCGLTHRLVQERGYWHWELVREEADTEKGQKP